MSFAKVACMDDVWSGEMISVLAPGTGRRVLLVNVEGTVCAYADRCRHKGIPLSEGTLAGHVLTCPAHEWQYDARTGAGINPENVHLESFSVKIEDGDIWIDAEHVGHDAIHGDTSTVRAENGQGKSNEGQKA